MSKAGPGRKAQKHKLSIAETTRLFPHTAGLFAQLDWPNVPKTLAVALAEHRVLEEQAARIQDLASSILERLAG